MSIRRRFAAAFAMPLLLLGAPAAGGEDARRPQAHFRVDDPARLDAEQAERIYQRIRGDMAAAYRLSELAAVASYAKARRVTARPYRSGPHGARFVNHWANARAARYADPGPPLSDLPAGALIAKDSFTVTQAGDVYSGPLFLMEKMPAGFAAETGDWRYTMVMPDGSLFGRTGGPGGDRVAFCAACHAGAPQAGDGAEPLFGVPAGLPE